MHEKSHHIAEQQMW